MKVEKSKNTSTGSIEAGKDVRIGDNVVNNHYYSYGGKHVKAHLTPPPFFPEFFIGREQELHDMRVQLQSSVNASMLIINGQGGIGKTSLAARYYHQYHHEYTHKAWLLSDGSIIDALLQLATPLQLQFDTNANGEECLNLLLTTLVNLTPPCLLVLDNTDTLIELETNYKHLLRLPNFHILLTSRVGNFEQERSYAIEGLPEHKAIALFRKHYPKLQQEEEDLLKQIRYAVGGNTLVLELLAKNLRKLNTLKTRYRLEDLLYDLQERSVLALSQKRAVHTHYGSLNKATPEAIIEAMYNLGKLTYEEIYLLSIFAMLPPEKITFTTLENFLSNQENLDELLIQLVQKGWLEQEGNSFKCSPVIQEVVRLKSLNSDLDFELYPESGWENIHFISEVNYGLIEEYIVQTSSEEKQSNYLAIFTKGLQAIEQSRYTYILKFACEAKTRNSISREEIPDISIPKLKAYSKLAQMYEILYLAWYRETVKFFQEAQIFFRENHTEFPFKEQRFIIGSLLNLGAMYLRKGRIELSRQLVELYLLGLDTGLLLQGGFITNIMLNNMVSLATAIPETKLAIDIVNKYGEFLRPNTKVETKRILYAQISFAEKDFINAKQLLDYSYKEVSHELKAKVLYICCMYEEQDTYQSIDNKCKLFSQLLALKDSLYVVAFRNFLSIFRKLIDQKESRETIVSDLDKSSTIFLKTWLLEKLRTYHSC